MKYVLTKRILLWVACLGFLSFHAYGQQNNLLPKKTPQSPNMASLGKYGDYQVNLFTGLPTIDIPLFTAKSGDLSVPISLSYHASGIRVTDQASWVGLGWTLNTGGAINRSIKGKADESAGGYLSNFNASVDVCNYDYLKNIAYSSSDGEPDVFSYNMPGKSGKFILQRTGSPLTIPYDPVSIVRESTLASFDMTDESGVMYKFGKDPNGVSKVEYNSEGKTAWMLTQMKAPNSDDVIGFTYKAGGQVQTSDLSSQISVTDGEREQNANGEFVGPEYPVVNETFINHGGSSVVVYPERIIFENGEVHFIQYSGTDNIRKDIASNQYALDRIEIWEKVNGTLRMIRTIKFLNTTYFTNALGQNAALKLDGIQIKDAAGKDVENYGFQYHTNSFSWKEGSTNPLYMRDFWGYYNGASINSSKATLMPVQTINIQVDQNNYNQTIGGANRNPNSAYSTQGVLKRITFPTGGYTEFNFEANKYFDDVSKTAKIAGGIRIENIKSYDGVSTSPVIKSYKYGLKGTETETGYGQKNFFESLAFYNFTNFHAKYTFDGLNCYTSRSRTYVSSSMEQLENFDGSSVIYPYVTEYQGTTTTHNGKIVYEFDQGTPTGDNIAAIPLTGTFKRISNHWNRGHLSRKTTYDKNGKPVAEQQSLYTTINQSTTRLGLMAFQAVTTENVAENANCRNLLPTGGVCGSTTGHSYRIAHSYYDISTGVKKVRSSVEGIYDQNSSTNKIETIANFSYNNSLQLTESIESTSNGTEEIVTRYRYPQIYSTSNAAIAKLTSQNILTTPIEKYVIRQNSGGSNARVISGQLTSFRLNESDTNQVVADKIYTLTTTAGIPLSRFVVSTAVSSGFSKDLRYTTYGSFKRFDAKGNILELSKESDVPIIYLWDHAGTLPVAEVTNSASTDFAYTSFEEDSYGNWTINSTTAIRTTYAKTGSRSYLIDGITISKGGLSSSKTYIVSYWVRATSPLSGVPGTATKVASAGTWTLYHHKITGYTIIPIIGTGYIDDLRIYPEGAQMTTYVHRALTGITSSSDLNGLPTSYIYDSFGRLHRLEDYEGKVIEQYEYNLK